MHFPKIPPHSKPINPKSILIIPIWSIQEEYDDEATSIDMNDIMMAINDHPMEKN